MGTYYHNLPTYIGMEEMNVYTPSTEHSVRRCREAFAYCRQNNFIGAVWRNIHNFLYSEHISWYCKTKCSYDIVPHKQFSSHGGRVNGSITGLDSTTTSTWRCGVPHHVTLIYRVIWGYNDWSLRARHLARDLQGSVARMHQVGRGNAWTKPGQPHYTIWTLSLYTKCLYVYLSISVYLSIYLSVFLYTGNLLILFNINLPNGFVTLLGKWRMFMSSN